MSPSRTRKPVAHVRPRHELIVAIASGTAIVLGTVLLIWLLRPGPPSADGGGGLMNRQQRASLLFAITLVALIAVIWWLLRRYKARRVPTRLAIAASVIMILVLSLIAGLLWPGGLIHHYQSLVQVPDNPIQTPTPTSNAKPPTGSTTPGTPAPSTPASSTPAPTNPPAPSSTPTSG